MKKGFACLTASLFFALPAAAQVKPADRGWALDSDPEVVYLEEALDQPIELEVAKEAPVFGDKEGVQRRGTITAGRKVRLEAISERAYRIRTTSHRNTVAGWVAPWAFSSEDPEFTANLKKLYERQMAVKAYIAAKEAAVGMTTDEVTQALGKPTKTSVRRTGEGESGQWEFIDYEERKHYVTRVNPANGAVYRQLSHVTREERSKTVVEFENGIVTAVEQSEDHGGGNVRIVVPPIVFGW